MSEEKEVRDSGGSILSNFLKFWLPWIFGVVSSTITIWQLLASGGEYRLEYVTRTVASIPSSFVEYPVSVTADGESLPLGQDYYLHTVTIWNAGQKPILGSDFRSPLAVDIAACRAFAIKVVGESTLGTDGFTPRFVPTSRLPTSVELSVGAFDPGEAIKLAFLSGCAQDNVRFRVESPIIREISPHISVSRIVVSLIGVGFLIIAMFMMEVGFSTINRKVGRPISTFLFVVVVVFAGSSLYLGLLRSDIVDPIPLAGTLS